MVPKLHSTQFIDHHREYRDYHKGLKDRLTPASWTAPTTKAANWMLPLLRNITKVFNMEDKVPETLINNVLKRQSPMMNWIIFLHHRVWEKISDMRIHGDMEEGILEIRPPPWKPLRNHVLYKVHSLNFPGMETKSQEFLRPQYWKVWIYILTCTWPIPQITPNSRKLKVSVTRKLGNLVKMVRLQTATSCRGDTWFSKDCRLSW